MTYYGANVCVAQSSYIEVIVLEGGSFRGN
jgi:hypothetical protein